MGVYMVLQRAHYHRNIIRQAIGPFEDLLAVVRKRKLKCYGHVARSKGLAKTVLEGTVRAYRRRGKKNKRWEDNISEWTGLSLSNTTRCCENRTYWRMLVGQKCVARQQSNILRD